MARILVVEGNKVKPVDQTRFTLEGKLQDYLEEYPSLVPLGEIVEGASDLVCIGREVGVSSGSVDLLFIDQDGVLTVAETKLARNPEARRTVVGQIIEYASYIYDWTADDVYMVANEYFSNSDKAPSDYRGCTLDEVMEKFTGGGFSRDDFRDSIEQNLRTGKVRLLIAVDELVEPLRATVTFLNRNSNFDILLLSVKSFEESESRKVLIPSLFGYVSRSPGGVRVQSTTENFFDDVKQKCDEGVQRLINKLYEFSVGEAVKISWGTGAARRSFIFHGVKPGLRIFTVFSDGEMWNNVGWARDWEDKLGKEKTNFLMDFWTGRLKQILDRDIPKKEVLNVNIKDFADGDRLDQFESAVLSLCQEIEAEG